jgi:hypothetical protein
LWFPAFLASHTLALLDSIAQCNNLDSFYFPDVDDWAETLRQENVCNCGYESNRH